MAKGGAMTYCRISVGGIGIYTQVGMFVLVSGFLFLIKTITKTSILVVAQKSAGDVMELYINFLIPIP